MGHRELLDTLRREGERRLGELRREAEGEAAAVRESARKGLEELREEGRRQEALAVAERRAAALREGRAEAARLRLEADRELAARLWRLSCEALPELRGGEVFDALAAELPPAAWQALRVNPADRERAGERFPDAAVDADPSVRGGLEATAAGVRVVNTLEKRLERAWAELLPRLLGEVHRKVEGHDAPGNA